MPGYQIVWWGRIKTSKAKIRRARLGKGVPPRVFRISFYRTTFHHYLGAWNSQTLLRCASAITEQKKCWGLLTQKFDRFQFLRNNMQQGVGVQTVATSNTQQCCGRLQWGGGYSAGDEYDYLRILKQAFTKHAQVLKSQCSQVVHSYSTRSLR